MKTTVINNNYDSSVKSAFSVGKAFLYLAGLIFITAAVALGLSAGFEALLNQGGEIAEKAAGAFPVLLVISGLGIIIMSFLNTFIFLRGGKAIAVPAIIYSVLMGILLSTFALIINWSVLGIAFLATAFIFLILGLIGNFAQGKVKGLVLGITGLVLGVGFFFLSSLIFSLIFGDAALTTLFMIIEGVYFVIILLVTIVDFANMNAIAARGQMNDNLALLFAYNLYNDFIYIFIKLLQFIIRLAVSFKRN